MGFVGRQRARSMLDHGLQAEQMVIAVVQLVQLQRQPSGEHPVFLETNVTALHVLSLGILWSALSPASPTNSGCHAACRH